MTKILVVDDLESHLYLAKSLLEPNGYEVVIAGSRDEALHALRNKGPFDLIISDIGMPQGNGFDFIAKVKSDERFRDIPFVFITATYWEGSDKKKAQELGAAKLIFRPMEARAILTEIEEVLPPEKRAKPFQNSND